MHYFMPKNNIRTKNNNYFRHLTLVELIVLTSRYGKVNTKLLQKKYIFS